LYSIKLANRSPDTQTERKSACFLREWKDGKSRTAFTHDFSMYRVGQTMKISKSLFAAAALFVAMPLWAVQAAGQTGQAQVAGTPPVFLKLEITSACTPEGTVIKIVNRGAKWPATGFLRLYHSQNKSLISERRLRLGAGQKVSFVVHDKISGGRPVAVWIDPEWYKRDFEYDANVDCKATAG
jgi:hypothetical protein